MRIIGASTIWFYSITFFLHCTVLKSLLTSAYCLPHAAVCVISRQYVTIVNRKERIADNDSATTASFSCLFRQCEAFSLIAVCVCCVCERVRERK